MVAKTFAFVSLGCPKNLVDSERMLGKLAQDGYTLVPDADGADVVVVNTCGFIEPARQESLAVVREMLEETGLTVRAEYLVGIYYWHASPQPWIAFVFRCEVERGEPAVPSTGEIAEVGWFDPDDLPVPLTNLAPYAIPDAVRGGRGLVREFPPRA